jgi:hypothetical protein
MERKEHLSMEQLWPLLTSSGKLERDRGLEQMELQLKNDSQTVFHNQVLSKLSEFHQALNDTDTSWEAKLGFLQTAKVLFANLKQLEQSHGTFGEELVRISLNQLTDPEVRVRQAAGELLGQLCSTLGPQVYEASRERVLELIKSNLERSDEDQEDASSKLSSSPKDASAIFHDTAGWRNLETSMKALERMVEGCGDGFIPFLDQNLLDLVID